SWVYRPSTCFLGRSLASATWAASCFKVRAAGVPPAAALALGLALAAAFGAALALGAAFLAVFLAVALGAIGVVSLIKDAEIVQICVMACAEVTTSTSR